MIQQSFIQEWRASAPWQTPAQVEQDLIICRAVVEIYSEPLLAGALAGSGDGRGAAWESGVKPPQSKERGVPLGSTAARPRGRRRSVTKLAGESGPTARLAGVTGVLLPR